MLAAEDNLLSGVNEHWRFHGPFLRLYFRHKGTLWGL